MVMVRKRSGAKFFDLKVASGDLVGIAQLVRASIGWEAWNGQIGMLILFLVFSWFLPCSKISIISGLQ